MTGTEWDERFARRVETITGHIMLHEGYTPARIEAARQATHQAAGCEFNANSLVWLCENDAGQRNHPDWDALGYIAEMVRLTLEENERLGGL